MKNMERLRVLEVSGGGVKKWIHWAFSLDLECEIQTTMTEKEIEMWHARLIEAMKLSGEMLIKRTKQLGQRVVVSRNGVIRVIEPEDL